MKVELRGVSKSFGPVRANQDITLTIPSGTIQGILGENGAGKSTLMKILSGFFEPDAGEVALDGAAVKIDSPADAIHQGIGMLHQDPLDFPVMRVLENFVLGQERGLFFNLRRLRAEVEELAAQFGFSINPDAQMRSLTVGERQQLEILRLLWLGVQVLILDEPTTGISLQQKEKLFETLRLLTQQGKTVIFVSHKLEEVEELCNQVAVLRQGQLVGEAQPPYRTDGLVEMMFGRVVRLDERVEAPHGRPVLEIHGLQIETSRLRIEDVDLEIRAGEVIGLAGMEGSGQRTLLRACVGLTPLVHGKIRLIGHDLTGRPYHAFLKHGVAYLPASRMEEGLFPGLTLTEHFVLRGADGSFFVDWPEGLELAEARIREFSIRGRPSSTVESLSGGNQQRALLALLDSPLSLLLMEHPTRGLDMESAIWVWRRLKERCQDGTAIFFISADLEEILHYSDRILVFFGGHVSAPLEAAQTSVDQLGQLIGGKGF